MEQKNLDQIIRETVARYMNRSLIVAGNWKMNMTVREGMEFLEKLGPVGGFCLLRHQLIHFACHVVVGVDQITDLIMVGGTFHRT